MAHFLNKIWNDAYDDSVHSQFIRFSKGVFANRAVLKVRKSDRIKLNSTFDLANDFVELASELGGGVVSGDIMSKRDISGVLSKNNINGNVKEKKGGLFYKAEVENQNVDGKALKEILENSYMCLLDIEGKDFTLKIKKKLPKPNPKGEGKVNDKFCVMEIASKDFPKVKAQLLFGLPDGKRYEVRHTYIINEIVIPSGEKDPEQMRLKAKRKGKIVRKAIVDKKEIIAEKEFSA